MAIENELRNLPGVDALLKTEAARSLIDADEYIRYGQRLVVEATRSWLGSVRRQILDGCPCPSEQELVEGIAGVCNERRSYLLQNATVTAMLPFCQLPR